MGNEAPNVTQYPEDKYSFNIATINTITMVRNTLEKCLLKYVLVAYKIQARLFRQIHALVCIAGSNRNSYDVIYCTVYNISLHRHCIRVQLQLVI